MKALLLAAGKGTRLGDISLKRPKCLQSVGGQVLLDRLLSQLAEVGVREFFINTHHLGEMVEGHIQASEWAGSVTLLPEDRLLGTLGTIRANAELLHDEELWVLHADNFIEGGLNGLKSAFVQRENGLWGVMLTFLAQHPAECGVVMIDSDGRLQSFHEKVPHPPSNLASAATFIFANEVLDLIRHLPDAATDLSSDLIPSLHGRLLAVRHTSQVIDIGTPIGLARAKLVAQVNTPNQ